MKRLVPVLVLSFGLAACGGTTSPTGPSGTSLRVSGVTPTSGTTFGGTTVTISGSNFSAGATVTIGGTAATDVTIAASGTMTAVTPQHASGAADVVVRVGTASATLPGAFTFVAPPPTTNTPPVITSITAQGTRANEPAQFADLSEAIAVTAAVTDAETPVADLTYQWSAPVGTFTGSGASVTWTAPAQMSTPATVSLSLVVIETYTTTGPDGLPVQQQNRVTGGVAVSVHDSVREVSDMTYNFLVAFSQQLPVDTVLQDFRDGCGGGGVGKQSEYEDVVNNQINYTIVDHNVRSPVTTVEFGGVCSFRARSADACAEVQVDWWSVHKTGPYIGTTEHAYGTDQVTAVYYGPQDRWWLCDSDFNGVAVNLLTGEVRPGVFFKK